MEEQIKTDEIGQNEAKPVTAKKRKEKRLTFGKVFLASLLAVVAGSVITMVFWLGLFSGIASMMESDGVAVPERAVLRIDLAEHLVDAPSKDPLSGFNLATMSSGGSLTLYDALRAIEAARDDDRIEGIYIRLDGGGTTTPNILEELRAAIVDFKQSGKFVVAYNEVYSQWTYYLCSAADKIYIQPEGGFDWSGITLTTMFYKGLIDKLGIEVDILRPTACKFKSAVEPMFLTQMSEANRMQMQAIADNMWSVITEAVSEARGISVDELNRIADDLAVTLPQEAVEHKFVDATLYADEVEDVFGNDYDLEDPEFISLKDYASGLTADVSKVAEPKVAVVYANGNVLDGNGTDDNIYGYTFSKTLKNVAEDDDVKAVVVRVNSPGGSALASDIIWREMELLREKKPVIISMGQYAASGGYYISAPADAIVADRLTLTGSIGVYGMLPAVGKALKDKIGITFDGVVTNKYSDMGNGVMGLGLDPLNEKEYNTVMRGVDRVYDRFTSIVAEGRNLPIEKVLEIAEGRVWIGSEAQKIGLVDTCGGLTAALAVAVDKADLGDGYQIVEIKEEAKGFMAILQSLNVSVREKITARSELGQLYAEYKRMEDMIGRKGVYTYCPYIFRFE